MTWLQAAFLLAVALATAAAFYVETRVDKSQPGWAWGFLLPAIAAFSIAVMFVRRCA